MSDESEFLRALSNAKIYDYINIEFETFHPTIPGEELYIDNLAQKGETIFIFEGKKRNLERAVNQLKNDFLSIKFDREKLIRRGKLRPYNQIRLFYYSFKRGLLIEFNHHGRELIQYRFDKRNINQLTDILRNI